MIKSIVLENWRTHAKSSFEFNKGTNVLVGQMGSGKSSVMDAICFGLFGTFPALQAKRVSLEEIITGKPNKENLAIIKMEFAYNEKNFFVERTVKRKGTNEAKLYCNEKFLAGPKTTDVTKAIEKELEINYNLFSRAVYSEQNQMDFFLRLAPLQRKEQFDELLDLKKYEKARANSVSISNRLKEIASERKDWLGKQKKIFDEKEIFELEQKILQKKKSNSELEEKIEKTKKEIEKTSEKLIELEKQEKEFRALKERIISLEAEAKEMHRNIEETKKSLKGKKNLEIEKELQEKEKEIEKFLEETKKTELEINEAQEKANFFIKEQGLNEEKIARIEKALRELQLAKSSCPVCKSTLNEKTKKQLIEENNSEKTAIGKKEKEIIEKLKSIKEKLVEKKLEREKFGEKRAKAKEEIIALKALLKEFESIEKKEKQFFETEKELEKAKKQLQKIPFDEQELKSQRQLFIEAKSLVEAIEKEKNSNLELIAQFQENLKKTEETKKQLVELEKEIKKIEKTQEKTIIFTNSLKAVQAELRSLLVENINIAMDDIWQKIYPYEDFSSARLEIEEGNYELKVKDRLGNWVRVEGILSGGERSAAALCIRIAFSLVLAQNLSWLILDEPTHNLDANAVRILSNMMREQLPELVEQIFIITHDREMEKAASASLYVLNREKNSDGATKPEQLAI